MDHLTIPIPDGIPAEQKRDLAGYLTEHAKGFTGEGVAIDDDPDVRASIVEKIKRGMADIEAGRFVDGREAMQRIADKNGLTLPG